MANLFRRPEQPTTGRIFDLREDDQDLDFTAEDSREQQILAELRQRIEDVERRFRGATREHPR